MPNQPPAPDLEREKFLHERELTSRELKLKEDALAHRREQAALTVAFKDRELDLRHRHMRFNRWSAPVVVAMLGGLIALIGGLYTSCENRRLERTRQESNLVLEAIKTGGTNEQKDVQTAANLVFLTDAGLITSIPTSHVNTLRDKANGAGPSLPAPQLASQTMLSAEIEALHARLQESVSEYKAYLQKIGFDLGEGKDPISINIDPEYPEHARFTDNRVIVVGIDLARNEDYTIAEYTWHALHKSNPDAYAILSHRKSYYLKSFGQGLKLYLTCSYLDRPQFGRIIDSATPSGSESATGALVDLHDFVVHVGGVPADSLTPYKLGPIWAAAFWELREDIGQAEADRLLVAAWQNFKLTAGDSENMGTYVKFVLDTAASRHHDPLKVRRPFERRRLLPE